MADEWERVAEAVRTRRKQQRMTQAELGAKSGTSEPTVRHLENLRRRTFSADTLAAISQALGWTPDSIDNVLGGGEPRPVTGHLSSVSEDDGDHDIYRGLTPTDAERIRALEAELAELRRRDQEKERRLRALEDDAG